MTITHTKLLNLYGISKISQLDTHHISWRIKLILSLARNFLQTKYVRTDHLTSFPLEGKGPNRRILLAPSNDPDFQSKLAEYIIIEIAMPFISLATYNAIDKSETHTELLLTGLARITRIMLDTIYPGQTSAIPWDAVFHNAWRTGPAPCEPIPANPHSDNALLSLSSNCTAITPLSHSITDPYMQTLTSSLISQKHCQLEPEKLFRTMQIELNKSRDQIISRTYKIFSRKAISEKYSEFQQNCQILFLREMLFSQKSPFIAKEDHLLAHEFYNALLQEKDTHSALTATYQSLDPFSQSKFTSLVTRSAIRRIFISTFILFSRDTNNTPNDLVAHETASQVFDQAFPLKVKAPSASPLHNELTPSQKKPQNYRRL